MSGTEPNPKFFGKKGETAPFSPEGAEADKKPLPANVPEVPGITLQHEIARGGMGVVYAGRQDFLDRRVAVKFLSADLGGDAFAKRFQREAKILAGINHPNIVACHMADTTPDGMSYLVMEFIDGPSLKAWILDSGVISPLASLRLVRASANALAHAHLSEIIHRDVKPENILLESLTSTAIDVAFPFTPKLVDLGLARMTHEQVGMGLTSPGSVMGTPSTMSPEQFDDPDSVDFRSDIYGLGCCLYEMLVGRPAFDGNKLTEIVMRKRESIAPNPCEANPGVPAAVGTFCQRLLACDRDNRPASYKDLDDEVAALIGSLESSGQGRMPIEPDAGAGATMVSASPFSAGSKPPAAAPSAVSSTPSGSSNTGSGSNPGVLHTGELDFLSEGGAHPGSATTQFQEPGANDTSPTTPIGAGAGPAPAKSGGKGLMIGVGLAVVAAGVAGVLLTGPGGGGKEDPTEGGVTNAAPTIASIEGEAKVDLGNTFELTVAASDADGDPLGYEWVFPRDCMSARSDTNKSSIKLRIDDGLPGVQFAVTCRVSDGKEGGTMQIRHEVEVSECPEDATLANWKNSDRWQSSGRCGQLIDRMQASGRVEERPASIQTKLGPESFWEWSGRMSPTNYPDPNSDDDSELPGIAQVRIVYGGKGYGIHCTRTEGETVWSVKMVERTPGTDEWPSIPSGASKLWTQPAGTPNEHRAYWSIRRERSKLTFRFGQYVQPMPEDATLPMPDARTSSAESIVFDLSDDDARALDEGTLELVVLQSRAAFRAVRN
ncbi:MAG: serine/threonine protein kinase [Planctomycetota bacterium]